MKITINGKEIKLTDEQKKEIKKEAGDKPTISLGLVFEDVEEDDDWPRLGDKYWSLDSYGKCYYIFENDEIDRENIKRGNIYLTEEEAEKADRKRIALATIWAYWEKNCKWDVDWRDGESKHFVRFDHKYNKFFVDSWFNSQTCPFLPVYSLEEQVEQAIKALEQEYKILFDAV